MATMNRQSTETYAVDPPLVRNVDDFWRVTDLMASVATLVCLPAGQTIVAYVLVAGLVSSWAARFVWACAQMVDANNKGNPPRSTERVTHRGSHLALTLTLYMALLQGAGTISYFLAVVLTLISLERVAFLVLNRRSRP